MTRYRQGVVEGPMRFAIRTQDVAELGPHDVVARVRAVGICGTDVAIFEGTLPYFASGLMKFPVVPGHEWSGEVIATGSEVTSVSAGDRITSEGHIGCGGCRHCLEGRYNQCPTRLRLGLVGLDGALAELVTVPERSVHVVPASIDFETATLIEPAAIAFRALEQVGPVAGRRAIVLGAGPVGLLVTAFLRAEGASWIGVVGLEPHRLEMAHRMGADLTADPSSDDFDELVRAGARGDGADIVVEVSGASAMIPVAIRIAGSAASIVLISMYHEHPVTFVPDAIVAKDLTIHGTLASPGVWDRTIRLLGSGRVEVSPLISHRILLADASRAFELARDRGAGVIKVVVAPNG